MIDSNAKLRSIQMPFCSITEEMYLEMERLIADAKPASRHLIGLNITQDIPGYLFAGGVAYDGDVITVYPG